MRPGGSRNLRRSETPTQLPLTVGFCSVTAQTPICSLNRLPPLNDDMKKFETSTDTDMQLLARFEQSRDQSAFAELVRRHGPMVMAAAMRELGNRDDAEDAPNPTSIRVTKSVIGWRCPARVLGFTCTSSLTFS